MKPLWCVGSPNISVPYTGPEADFCMDAWLAWPEDAQVSEVRIEDSVLKAEIEISYLARPDVERLYPGMKAKGFRGVCSYEKVRDKDFIRVSFDCATKDGFSKTHEMFFPTYRGARGGFTSKREKFSKLAKVLKCPNCTTSSNGAGISPGTGGNLTAASEVYVCADCNSRYHYDDSVFDFTEKQLSRVQAELDDSPQSANSYDPDTLNIIFRNQDGLILDFGSGVRDRFFDNVVNYEIHPNPTVDVLGDGERLPFKDDSFDGAMSIAVFEHVSNPFACAMEILRVVKPGGSIYLSVPFLFHEHGYPNHYYNMTQEGLKNLFQDQVVVRELDVLIYGQPICLLTIFLSHYVQGLPSEVAERFKNMRIGDFLHPFFGYLHHDYVTQLDEATKQKLACVNYIIADKKPCGQS